MLISYGLRLRDGKHTMTQAERIATLESLVDSEGLVEVCIALHLVCLEKAEHLICNWQDKATARMWERAATALKHAAENESVNRVS